MSRSYSFGCDKMSSKNKETEKNSCRIDQGKEKQSQIFASADKN
jgi:hypothetical protein